MLKSLIRRSPSILVASLAVAGLAWSPGCGDKSPPPPATTSQKTTKATSTASAQASMPRARPSARAGASAGPRAGGSGARSSASRPADGEPTSAEDAIRRFYDRLNKGDLPGAKSLYTPDVIAHFETQDLTEEEFAAFAKRETNDGALRDIKVLATAPIPGGQKIFYDIVFADSSTIRRSVDVVQVGGQWRVGVVDNKNPIELPPAQQEEPEPQQ